MEFLSDAVLLREPQDALDIIADTASPYVVLHERNLAADFFDLSTRKLGDLLQKFTNYQVRLAIIGDFAKYPSRALQAFIYESNRHGDYLFVSSIQEAIRIWQA